MYYKDENQNDNYGPEEEALIHKLCKHSVRAEKKVPKKHFPTLVTLKHKEEQLNGAERGICIYC